MKKILAIILITTMIISGALSLVACNDNNVNQKYLKSDNFSEQIVTDRLSAVTERVKTEVLASNDVFAAVIQGVDEPWDVALIELWLREIRRSAGDNIRELDEKGLLYGKND